MTFPSFIIFLKNNLDMNKEKLAAQLVCMLDVASRPQDVAELKQHIESFFSSGSARIDLIAKVLDLDNDIGGYNFDIPILIDTKTTIAKVGTEKGRFWCCRCLGNIYPVVTMRTSKRNTPLRKS